MKGKQMPGLGSLVHGKLLEMNLTSASTITVNNMIVVLVVTSSILMIFTSWRCVGLSVSELRQLQLRLDTCLASVHKTSARLLKIQSSLGNRSVKLSCRRIFFSSIAFPEAK